MNLTNNNVDIHCSVIDNYGDAGIALRLANNYSEVFPLAEVRVFIDDLIVLNKIESLINPDLKSQIIHNVLFVDVNKVDMNSISPASLVITLLQTPLPEGYHQKVLIESQLIIIIEGISAEKWVKEIHGSQSYSGGKALKFFYIPGFSADSGGLLFGNESKSRINDFLNHFDLFPSSDFLSGVLFHYGDDLNVMLECLNVQKKDIYLFVCGEKSQNAIKKIDLKQGSLKLLYPKFYNQSDFDDLLKSSDFNFIRGEDSLIQAINAQNPLFWQIYSQADSAHLAKLDAFLGVLELNFSDQKLFNDYKKLMFYYNGVSKLNRSEIEDIIYSFMNNLDKIRAIFQQLRKDLLVKGNLIERLIKFIEQI
ncbi:MAG: elongation factor P maturation arginine rhamnosyltransferase EarP [Candidatus Riflemargulisbacteria bacterium]